MISPYITAGAAEKMHGFYRKRMDMTAYDRAANHTTEPAKINNTDEWNRLTTVVSAASSHGTQIKAISGIPDSGLRAWSIDGQGVPEHFRQRAAALRTQMDDTFSDLKREGTNFSDPLLSTVNCFHWEGVEGNTDEQVVKFPLNTKITAYRAHTSSAPFISYEMTQGTSYVSYNSETGKIEVYVGNGIHSHFGDPETRNEADFGTVFVSPASGEGSTTTSIKSTNPFQGSTMAAQALNGRNMMYRKDYGFLFQDPSQACTSDDAAAVTEYIPTYQQAKDDWFQSQLSQMRLFTMVKNVLPCAINFLKPDHVNGAVYNVYMAGALIHALVEVLVEHIVPGLGARDWNSIDAQLI